MLTEMAGDPSCRILTSLKSSIRGLFEILSVELPIINNALDVEVKSVDRKLPSLEDVEKKMQTSVDSRCSGDEQHKMKLRQIISESTDTMTHSLVALYLLEDHIQLATKDTGRRIELFIEGGNLSHAKLLTSSDLDKILDKQRVILSDKNVLNKDTDYMELSYSGEKSTGHDMCTISQCNLDGKIESSGKLSNASGQILEIDDMITELRSENSSLRAELKLLKTECYETLAELGKLSFERTAKENEERNLESFNRAFCLPYNACVKGSGYASTDRSRDNYASSSQQPHESGNKHEQSRNEVMQGAVAVVHESHSKSGGDKNYHSSKLFVAPLYASKNEQIKEGISSPASTSSQADTNQRAETDASATIDATSSCTEVSEGQRLNQEQDGVQSLLVAQEHPSGQDYVSLGAIPPASVASTLYNNYKLLLLTISARLLSSDVVMLKTWGTDNFLIESPGTAFQLLAQLDEKGIINAFDLRQLREFLEAILRIDLVHIIDEFLLGDYGLLRYIPTPEKTELQERKSLNPQRRPVSRIYDTSTWTANRSPEDSQNASVFPTGAVGRSSTAGILSERKGHGKRAASNVPNGNAEPDQSYNAEQLARVHSGEQWEHHSTKSPGVDSSTSSGPVKTNSQTSATNVSTTQEGYFPRPEISHDSHSSLPGSSTNLTSNRGWLCSHYKRHCYVKFGCCNEFWPCHRCHNSQSKCGRKKLKSRDTQIVKCANCNKVQQFAEYCSDCNTKFASYCCGSCKHLTGTDDHPYHCDKCGICRIHGDRSFHCDTCGVCLDVQLRGNHKCREGSAHDECCICLEDAFTGCQILPCSHKVHRECANQMINMGMSIHTLAWQAR